jgi:alpha,alpha-trehalase
VDTEAVRFVRELRTAGVRVGVASSSENTSQILERAGLVDLFQAQVDGIVSERMQLAGKPAPDIFLKCLELLDVPDPERALVAEDAVVGVEAGRAGGFGLVLGVDRGERALALREHGADWIVRDFVTLTTAHIELYFENRVHKRPNALAQWAALAAHMQTRQPAIFLDYDGTLTPIVSRPELAQLSDAMRATLQRVSAAWPTTIVSGRGRVDVQRLVGIGELHYAGSHGFDIAVAGADGLRFEADPSIVPAISDAAAELESSTAGIPGILVAVHYRLVPEERVADVERAVDAAIAARPQLHKQPGKKIFELRPALEWDKGRAVLWLLESLGLDPEDVLPIYIGDDTTDEDAFRALEGRGIGILVADVPRPTAASHSLQDVEEVRVLLDRIAAVRAR